MNVWWDFYLPKATGKQHLTLSPSSISFLYTLKYKHCVYTTNNLIYMFFFEFLGRLSIRTRCSTTHYQLGEELQNQSDFKNRDCKNAARGISHPTRHLRGEWKSHILRRRAFFEWHSLLVFCLDGDWHHSAISNRSSFTWKYETPKKITKSWKTNEKENNC